MPAGFDQPAGLVINLHGAGMTGSAQQAATNYNAVADAHGFVAAYPDGIDLSWADGRGASIPDRQGVDDVGFLVALVDRLDRRSCGALYRGGMVGRGGPSEIEPALAMADGWRNVDGFPNAPVEDVPGGAVHRFTAADCADGTEVVLVRISSSPLTAGELNTVISNAMTETR